MTPLPRHPSYYISDSPKIGITPPWHQFLLQILALLTKLLNDITDPIIVEIPLSKIGIHGSSSYSDCKFTNKRNEGRVGY